MFWFLLLGLLLVIGAVTLAVNGSGVAGGRGQVVGGLADPVAERSAVAMPADRPMVRADVDSLRLPLALRGYRMEEVDDVLDRLGAELSERDARIAELEAVLAGVQADAVSGDRLFKAAPPQESETRAPAEDDAKEAHDLAEQRAEDGRPETVDDPAAPLDEETDPVASDLGGRAESGGATPAKPGKRDTP